jgi:putative SOS response-associated peptidase YedK
MCGRYEIHDSPQMLMLYFLLAEEPTAYSNADVRPTNEAPIIRVREGKRLALPARWGLIPSWAKDATIAQHTFNARAETIAEKPSFRSAFKRRRCIVPMSAFFEWRAIAGQKKKEKLRFASADGDPLAVAGLWERWDKSGDGYAVETFTVITTAANSFMAPIHDRMPAILAKSDWDAWLDPEMSDPVLLRSLLGPCPDGWLRQCSV